MMDAGSLAALGDALKRARLKKGESLEEAGRKTRIPKKFIDALENGRIDDFPAPVYAEPEVGTTGSAASRCAVSRV